MPYALKDYLLNLDKLNAIGSDGDMILVVL